MRTQRRITWAELTSLVEALAVKTHSRTMTGVYGIPTGGSVIAAMLAPQLGVPLVDASEIHKWTTLIVDDICDSGRTLRTLPDEGGRAAVIHVRPSSVDLPDYFVEKTEDWIVYPYEHQDAEGQGGQEVITRMIQLIGDDPTRAGLLDTPARVVRAWTELFAGYSAPKPTATAFEESYDEMVISRNIDFMSFCEHHILPFYGKAHICYIPDGKVLGISKLSRIVDYHARRLQIQERLTQSIANTIQESLSPKGLGVVLHGTHLCMVARGVRQAGSLMTTSAVRGVLRTEGPPRQEFLALMTQTP